MSALRRGLVVTLALLCGCQGSRASVGFNATNVPVSMSGALLDEAGAVIDSDTYVVISRFETEEKRSWSMFYTAAVIQKTVDFSEEINAAVAAAKGEAVVNLTIKSRMCGMNYALPLTLLPFWAGCVRIWVSGEIITRDGVPLPADAQLSSIGEPGPAEPPQTNPAAVPPYEEREDGAERGEGSGTTALGERS